MVILMTMTGEPTLNYWPLVVAIEDVYIPELAGIVIETISEVNINTVSAMMAIAAYNAVRDLRGREN